MKKIKNMALVLSVLLSLASVQARGGWGWGAGLAGFGVGALVGSAAAQPRTVYYEAAPTTEVHYVRKAPSRRRRDLDRLEDRIEQLEQENRELRRNTATAA